MAAGIATPNFVTTWPSVNDQLTDLVLRTTNQTVDATNVDGIIDSFITRYVQIMQPTLAGYVEKVPGVYQISQTLLSEILARAAEASCRSYFDDVRDVENNDFKFSEYKSPVTHNGEEKRAYDVLHDIARDATSQAVYEIYRYKKSGDLEVRHLRLKDEENNEVVKLDPLYLQLEDEAKTMSLLDAARFTGGMLVSLGALTYTEINEYQGYLATLIDRPEVLSILKGISPEEDHTALDDIAKKNKFVSGKIDPQHTALRAALAQFTWYASNTGRVLMGRAMAGSADSEEAEFGKNEAKRVRKNNFKQYSLAIKDQYDVIAELEVSTDKSKELGLEFIPAEDLSKFMGFVAASVEVMKDLL